MKAMLTIVAFCIVVIFFLAGCPLEHVDRCKGFGQDCVVDVRA